MRELHFIEKDSLWTDEVFYASRHILSTKGKHTIRPFRLKKQCGKLLNSNDTMIFIRMTTQRMMKMSIAHVASHPRKKLMSQQNNEHNDRSIWIKTMSPTVLESSSNFTDLSRDANPTERQTHSNSIIMLELLHTRSVLISARNETTQPIAVKQNQM